MLDDCPASKSLVAHLMRGSLDTAEANGGREQRMVMARVHANFVLVGILRVGAECACPLCGEPMFEAGTLVSQIDIRSEDPVRFAHERPLVANAFAEHIVDCKGER